MESREKLGVIPHFAVKFRSFVLFVIDFGFDTASGALVFGAFYLFAWIFALARTAGFAKPEHLEAFELVHFWLNYGLYSTIGIAFLWRCIKRIFCEE
jgi:hypothetical protein